MRWITVGPAGSPGTSIVLHRSPRPRITNSERRTMVEMMAKGTYAGILLATADGGTFGGCRPAAPSRPGGRPSSRTAFATCAVEIPRAT